MGRPSTVQYVHVKRSMEPADPVASSTQSASSVSGPNTHASKPCAGDDTLNVATSAVGRTDNEVVRVTPLYVAEIVADEGADTVDAVTTKVTLVEPAGTVTEAGNCAAPVSLLSVTSAPPLGAPAVSDTVPVVCPWLLSDDWPSVTADSDMPDPEPDPVEGVCGDGLSAVGLGDVGDEELPPPQPVMTVTKMVPSRLEMASRVVLFNMVPRLSKLPAGVANQTRSGLWLVPVAHLPVRKPAPDERACSPELGRQDGVELSRGYN
jgi:hypothetical protein